MARIYRVNLPTTWPEERALHGQITTEAQKASEALYEETRFDNCCILYTPENYASGYYFGPIAIPIRRDRDGHWRTPEIQPLFSGNGVAHVLVAAVTDTWRQPARDHLAGTGDPGTYWATTTSVSTYWGSASEISLPDSFFPERRVAVDDDEECPFRIGWLTMWWYSPAGYPKLCGYRLNELVEVGV